MGLLQMIIPLIMKLAGTCMSLGVNGEVGDPGAIAKGTQLIIGPGTVQQVTHDKKALNRRTDLCPKALIGAVIPKMRIRSMQRACESPVKFQAGRIAADITVMTRRGVPLNGVIT